GLKHPIFVPYGPQKAGDGRYFNVAVLSAEHWRVLCEDVIERLDLLADERYATMEGREEHRDALEPELEAAFATRGADEWVDALERAAIPGGLVREFPEVMEHPQLLDSGMIGEIGSPVGEIPSFGSPILVEGERAELGPVPALGEHTRSVLEGLGVSADVVDGIA
ncbi:MAG: CoA transferase, partial [Gaiellaceae bacterium]